MSLPVERSADFFVPWAAALAVSATQPAPVAPDVLVVHFSGLTLPVVELALAIAGVLMARPLARKKEAALPMSSFLVVTAIMLVIAVAWVAESKAGPLFTFVVAIGLGFSGYALIEMASAELQAFVKRVIAQVAGVFKFGAPK